MATGPARDAGVCFPDPRHCYINHKVDRYDLLTSESEVAINDFGNYRSFVKDPCIVYLRMHVANGHVGYSESGWMSRNNCLIESICSQSLLCADLMWDCDHSMLSRSR